MNVDESTLSWPTIIDTSDAYDVNFDSMATISNGTFTYGNISQSAPIWTTTNTTIGATGSNYQFNDWAINHSNVVASGQLNLMGDNADVVINGQSLNATLTAIQEKIGMLVPNPAMEAEWDELQELGKRYRELEKICKEKSEIWKKLKA
jgi:Ca2+-binding RTX toxin-like protein